MCISSNTIVAWEASLVALLDSNSNYHTGRSRRARDEHNQFLVKYYSCKEYRLLWRSTACYCTTFHDVTKLSSLLRPQKPMLLLLGSLQNVATTEHKTKSSVLPTFVFLNDTHNGKKPKEGDTTTARKRARAARKSKTFLCSLSLQSLSRWKNNPFPVPACRGLSWDYVASHQSLLATKRFSACYVTASCSCSVSEYSTVPS